ncbi:gamma carbonic anhydrase family protein [Dasania marina]|uniref:gamma carbonic anhydrase family protein n=1 Tax=Dasania marina TaxID=471499 RepID=UPI00035E5384|nr:gamma carbonic anhydrase family protein [Dasania marina]|tara:strand:- start:31786 stop:32310 length:525 start_codon:yes stop_codon:yes gene_type:complete
MLFRLADKSPQQEAENFIAHNATVVGDVALAADVSLWFNVVIRADHEKITVGKGSNIQDGCVLHADPGYPLTVGEGVTVGHKAVLHGCTVGDYSLVGINAVVLNGVTIGKHCLIGANSLVPEGMNIPDGSLVVGSPARIRRQLSEQEISGLHKSAEHYVANGRRFLQDLSALAD